MAPHERNKITTPGQVLRSFVWIIVAVILGVIALLAALDSACAADVAYDLPVYPDAELVRFDESADAFVRPRAMGETVAIYTTGDDLETVNDWYRAYYRANEGIDRGPSQSVRPYTYNGGLTEADDGGTQIVLRSVCGLA